VSKDWRWYRDRLRAMSIREIAFRSRAEVYAWQDSRKVDFSDATTFTAANFPILPPRACVPIVLAQQFAEDLPRLRTGDWVFFRAVPVHVDMPPQWDRDALAQVSVASNQSAFKLNHRALPHGADIKCLWEPSRWQHLTRLLMAAWMAEDREASAEVLSVLKHWVTSNPPYRGWQWTSALESGLRMIQICWMDALFSDMGIDTAELLREVLPAHTHFTWRHRTFGSSANNHAIGELAGLIVCAVRWPDSQRYSAPLGKLRDLLESEILAQFAPDGGNREQALNYHLFSLELCLHAECALKTASLSFSDAAQVRLAAACEFLAYVQSPSEPWDYGDSDDAYALPIFLSEKTSALEWRAWARGEVSPALDFWFNRRNLPALDKVSNWKIFSDSGYAVAESEHTFLRVDASPLGYLSTAAHGHCDALHLSAWQKGRAVLVDPGTGGYFGDLASREVLAGWESHNGPISETFVGPSRRGPFLWSQHHEQPSLRAQGNTAIVATKSTERSVGYGPEGWWVEDKSDGAFGTRWQFAPSFVLTQIDQNVFSVECATFAIRITISGSIRQAAIATALCSPSFRVLSKSAVLVVNCAGGILRTEFTPT